MKHTPLFEEHQKAGGKMVDFASWHMPLHYGSQIEEHKAVRSTAGMFDVSHMCVIQIQGNQAQDFLRYVLANDVQKIKPGQALYSCMLSHVGGIIDDLIVYHTPNQYILVVNAATAEKDLAWIQEQAQHFDVKINRRTDLCIMALQGPQAQTLAKEHLNHLGEYPQTPFSCTRQQDTIIASTGYTGESGYEFILPKEIAIETWQHLIKAKVTPCGLGARDSLRLEAGLNLYGTDMDEAVSPLESNLKWTVQFDNHDFIGKEALLMQQDQGIRTQLVGIVLEGRGVLRHGQSLVIDNEPCGTITSGTYSPTLGHSIAFARVKPNKANHYDVDIRGKCHKVIRVKPPFVKAGKPAFKTLENMEV